MVSLLSCLGWQTDTEHTALAAIFPFRTSSARLRRAIYRPILDTPPRPAIITNTVITHPDICRMSQKYKDIVILNPRNFEALFAD